MTTWMVCHLHSAVGLATAMRAGHCSILCPGFPLALPDSTRGGRVYTVAGAVRTWLQMPRTHLAATIKRVPWAQA